MSQTELEIVIRNMFRTMIGPLHTPAVAQAEMSRIACVVCDSASDLLKTDVRDHANTAMAIHLAYRVVRQEFAPRFDV